MQVTWMDDAHGICPGDFFRYHLAENIKAADFPPSHPLTAHNIYNIENIIRIINRIIFILAKCHFYAELWVFF